MFKKIISWIQGPQKQLEREIDHLSRALRKMGDDKVSLHRQALSAEDKRHKAEYEKNKIEQEYRCLFDQQQEIIQRLTREKYEAVLEASELRVQLIAAQMTIDMGSKMVECAADTIEVLSEELGAEQAANVSKSLMSRLREKKQN